MTQPTQPPRLRLDFYPSTVVMSRWLDDGRVIAHPVAIHDVAAACANLALSSGLLPPNTLFWKQQGDRPVIGLYVPARRWRMLTEERVYHLPMPPFLFVGRGTSYQIFASKKRPRDGRERLYHAPCPNVHDHGGICSGNAPFPVCSPQTIEAALSIFMEDSLFNGDLGKDKCRCYPEDVRQMWAELEGKKRFPLSELVSCRRVLRDLL